MSRKRFSIVIPTRERHETLMHSLKTCLQQNNFDDYEIIVCDNFGSPGTLSLINNINSSKIKYVKSDRPLAMVDNFELAVSHASGEYILTLGDDDGLLLDALYNLNLLIEKTKFKVISWNCLFYQWPGSVPEGLDNQLTIPLDSSSRIIKSKDIISSVASGRLYYSALPMIYTNSIVHSDLVQEVKKITGRVFHSVTPDIYSGFVFAYLAKEFLFINRPFSIAGLSSKSNGSNTLYTPWHNKITTEFINSNEASDVNFHSKLPYINSLSIMVAETFLQAKDRLFPDDCDFSIDKKELILNALEDLKVFSLVEWNESIASIKKTIDENNPELSNWFDMKMKSQVPHIFNPIKMQNFVKGLHGTNLKIDASSFQCKNVYDVSLFYHNALEERFDFSINNISILSETTNVLSDKPQSIIDLLFNITRRVRSTVRIFGQRILNKI